MRIQTTVAVLGLTLIVALSGTAGVPSAVKSKPTDCDRACLDKILNTYFETIAAHTPSKLPAAKNIRFTENGSELKIGQGLWQRGGPTSYRLDAADPESEQVASDAVITENGKKAILFVRLKVEAKKIAEVETFIVRPGEGQRSDPETLSQTTPTLYNDTVPPAQQASREELIGAANAYFAALETGGTDQYEAPPVADDATRVENGATPKNTGISNGPPRLSLPDQLKRGFGGAKLYVSDRRYPVFDQEHGIVLAIGLMHVHPPAGRSDGPPGHATDKPNRVQVLVEFFKITDGQIRQIQATMLDLDDPSNSTVGITNTGWTASDLPNK
jgi:hypothetical protein